MFMPIIKYFYFLMFGMIVNDVLNLNECKWKSLKFNADALKKKMEVNYTWPTLILML